MTRTKWLLYTVLLGAAPILTRVLVAFVLKDEGKKQWFSALDFLGFALALSLSNINVLQQSSAQDVAWRTKHVYLSLIIIVFVASASGVAYANESAQFMNEAKFTIVSLSLAVSSMFHNYAVSDRLEKQGVGT